MTPTGAASGCAAERHGTADAYRHARCRCDTALAAIRRYEKERNYDIVMGRPRTLPNVGAVRRVQALRALGWPGRILAERIGVDERNIARWPHRHTISRKHHDAVRRVYDELSHQPGPDERARRHAARQGWLPPLWWDDDTIDDPSYKPQMPNPSETRRPKCDIDSVAVERAIAGEASDLMRRGERLEAVGILHARGWTAARIADHMNISSRQVDRDLHDIRVAAERLAATPQKVSA